MLKRFFFKTIIFLGISLQYLPSIQASSILDKKISEIIDDSSSLLLDAWKNDDYLKKVYPPQVILLNNKVKVFGGCKSRSTKQLKTYTFSGYCGLTNTIYLLDDDLDFFYEHLKKHGVLLVLTHEWAHALQHATLSKLTNPKRELQADCLAGELIKIFDQDIKKEDIDRLSRMAMLMGSNEHGTGEQRKKALLTGLGELEGVCLNTESYL